MKTVAIAVMLLATTAFGAVNLTVDATPTGLTPSTGGQVTLSFKVATNTETDGNGFLTGISAKATNTANAGKITIVSRTAGSAFGSAMSDFTVGNVAGLAIEGPNDLGGTGPTGTAGTNGTGEWLSVVVNVPAAATYPVVLSFAGIASDSNYNDYNWTSSVSIAAVPEPASMLLLAVGGAFFARRRRA